MVPILCGVDPFVDILATFCHWIRILNTYVSQILFMPDLLLLLLRNGIEENKDDTRSTLKLCLGFKSVFLVGIID